MDVGVSACSFLSDELAQYRDVVVGNGSFPCHDWPLSLLRQARHIVCCDGAVVKLAAAGFMPSAVVGDCDSQNDETLLKWKNIIHVDKSVEYNDLQKALKFCIRKEYAPVALIGCEGLRDDHFIANISVMATYSTLLQMIMVTNYGIFNVIHQTTEFSCFRGGQISIFSPDTHLPLSFFGLRYPVSHRSFEHLWEGSLNEAVDTMFRIELHAPGTVIVYRAF